MAAKKRPATRAVASDRQGKASANPRSSSMPATKAKASAKATSIGKTTRANVEKKSRARPVAAASEARSSRKEAVKSAAPKPVSKSSSSKSSSSKSSSSKSSSSKLAAASTPLQEGDRAPRFELTDHRGEVVSSEDLANQPYVLYFYPKDDTPGCTVEACGFRDAATEFDEAGVRVIGVSPDNVASHQKFIAKHKLPFTLLCDGEQELATAYGTWALKKNYGREYMGIVRSTFLIGADGMIKKAWRSIRVNGHVAAVQAAAQELS